MRKKAYIITFDKDFFDGIDYQKIYSLLTTANGVIDWWHYLESTYIIIVDRNITAKNVSDLTISIMPNKKHFVCELVLSNHNGWLTQDAWDWIKKQTLYVQ